MSLRGRIERIVEGMPADAQVSLSVSWLRRVLEEEPEATDGDPVLTLVDVAERLGVAVSTVRTWCNSGDLDGFKLNGRTWRVRESALERYLHQQTKEASDGPALGQGREADLGSWRQHVGDRGQKSA